MSNLPLEVVEMFGQTIAKVVPVTIGAGAGVLGADPFLGLQSGHAVVAQEASSSPTSATGSSCRCSHAWCGSGFWCSAPASFFNIHDADELIAFYDNGHGPLAQLPLWVQAMLFLVLSDFMLYWLHRMFHGGGFWKYHAIHHSSEDLDWISAARFHPVNLFLGTIRSTSSC